MVTLRLLPLVAAWLLLLGGCATAPKPPSTAAMRDVGSDTIEHVASGMRFPPSRDGFARASIRQYDTGGLNVSAGYNSVGGRTPIVITIYVYPTPPARGGGDAARRAEERHRIGAAEFQQAKSEVIQARPEVKLIDETEVPGPEFAPEHGGHFARFAYPAEFAGRFQPLESLLYLYCHVGGAWTVKYRISYPASSIEARGVMNRFMQELPWTIQPPSKQ